MCGRGRSSVCSINRGRAVVLAGATAAGVDGASLALQAPPPSQPWLVFVAGFVWGVIAAVQRRREGRVSAATEAVFLTALTAELRAGASLRRALPDAAARVPDVDLARVVRMAEGGLPMEGLAKEIATALPARGPVASGAIGITAQTGAQSAATFEALAARASFAADLERERRTLTAQAKLSAVVVGGGPLLFAVVLLLTGRLGTLLDNGAVGITIGVVGLGLELAGLAVVAALLWRRP